MKFPRQAYWSGLPFPPTGDLSNPGIEPLSPVSPDWQAGSLPLSRLGAYSCLWGAIIHPTIGVFPALVFLSLRIILSSTTRIEPCSPMYCTSWPELPEP